MGSKREYRLLALGLLFSGTAVTACSDQASDFPEVDGWTQTGEVLTYEADNLWEYINGAAELFVAYGVLSCRTADLMSGDVMVTVDLYDMGTPLNAYGVFDQEASGETVDVPDATAAMISPPYQALLLKGSTYAKVNAFEGELNEAAGQQLMEALASSLPGPSTLPEELQLLPPGGRVAGTEAYQAEAFLGLSELTACVFAEYAGEGEATWQGFVVVPDAAESVWATLSGDWETVDHEGSTILVKDVPYRGLVGVTRREDGLFGVSGAADLGQLFARLDGFRE